MDDSAPDDVGFDNHRPGEAPEPTWVTGAGERIRVRDMADRHIENAVGYMERNWRPDELGRMSRYQVLCAERARRCEAVAAGRRRQAPEQREPAEGEPARPARRRIVLDGGVV